MTKHHTQLIQEEIKRKQQRMGSGHRASTLFLNMLAAEVTGLIVGNYIGKPYKKPIDRFKNRLIKKAFKL